MSRSFFKIGSLNNNAEMMNSAFAEGKKMTLTSWAVIIGLVFLILLVIAIKKEWNGFLLFCNLVIFLPALVITVLIWIQMEQKGELNPMVFFSGAAALATLIGMFTVVSRSRCPECKKFFAARKTNDELIQAGDIYYKTENNTRVAYQKNLYQRDYICKHCGHEWSRNISREEKA